MGSTKVQAPPPRDYYKESMDTMRAQIDMAPMMLEAERKLVPQWQQLQLEQMRGQANNLQTFYGEVMDPFSKLAGEYATKMGANAMAPLGQASRTAYESSLGGGQNLQSTMRGQAMTELGAGRGLTAEMEKYSQQAARSAMAARGLSGNQAVAQEVLNSYQMGNMREDRSRTFATQVLGNDMNIAQAGYNQYGAPMMQGMMQGFSPTGIATNAMGMNSSLGPQFINPQDQMAQNINAGNYNAQLQANVATASNNAAVIGGGLSAAGSIFKGVCWVAREVYGVENPDWLIFREWLYDKAPAWFRKFYLKHGEKFAEFISNKPMLKSIVRSAMNIVVNSKKSNEANA